MGYAGFLRFDEISRLKCYDILISEEHMFIFIESSKTDQYRDGSWIPLSRTPNITCPVKNLQRYAEFARISFDEDKHLFCGITKTRNNEK